MGQTRAVVCVLLALALPAAAGWKVACAADAPPLASLRHLVFAVNVQLKDEYERLQSSQSGTPPKISRSGMTVIPPDEHVGTATYNRHSKGQIVCDVVAATQDGGLVVDVAEDAVERAAPRVRVAIESNGHLNYPPGATVFEEEVALLRLLGRGVIGQQPHDVGASWSIDDKSQGYASKTKFRVTAIEAAGDLGLDIDEQYHREGIDAMFGAVEGTVTYDRRKLVPRLGNFRSHVRRQTSEGYRAVQMEFDLALIEDSFAGR